MLLTTPNHIKIMPKQSLSQVDKLSIGTSVLEPNSDMVDLRLPIASFAADSNQLDKFVVSSVMSSGKAIGVHEIGLWHEGELVAIIYKTHDRVNHQPLFLIKPNFIYLVNLQIDEQTVTLTIDERDDLSFAMAGVLANTSKQSSAEKIALTNQFKALVDKDSSLENKISSLTGNVATVQRTADNASEKSNTATTKADNAQNTANNALSRANAANSAITAEQKAREDADTTLEQRITAIDTSYKKSDTDITARLAREETARASGDNTNAQALRTLESTVNGINGRVGTSESKIATLERTTSDTNQALATAQSQMNARFDNLAVGGRNRFKKSTQFRNIGGTGTITHNSENGVTFTAGSDSYTIFRLLNVIDEITDYTISGYVKSSMNSEFYIDVNDIGNQADPTQPSRQSFTKVTTTTEYQKFNVTIKNTRLNNVYQFVDLTTLSTATFDIKYLKIEKGTIETDWTPAAEDLVNGLLVYSTTTAQSPNVFVSDTGQMQRSTSSERYKHVIGDLTLDKKSYQKAMSLNPIIYRSTAENDNPDWHYYSFSAEKLGAFDKAFTLWRTPTTSSYDDDGNEIVTTGEPIAEGINLNAVVAFLHATNLHQGMLIDELTKRIEVLEQNQNME